MAPYSSSIGAVKYFRIFFDGNREAIMKGLRAERRWREVMTAFHGAGGENEDYKQISGKLLLVYAKQRYTPCRNEQRRNPVAIAPYFISMVPKPGFEPGQAYAH
jgi:hypothetical protein